MPNHILHKAATRGHANHGWLNSYQTFSFSSYYNPERIQFGALRVLNDDIVAGGKGFGIHPHENMEIISIPLEGALEHQDNLGNTQVTKAGEIQVMSTGSGVFHSEYNYNKDKDAKFLQIWLYPRELNVTPRYVQTVLNTAQQHNQLQQIISPDPEDAGSWIHQDAWFHLGTFDKDQSFDYTARKAGNGIYVFIISGSVNTNGQLLEQRDGLGITGAATINITSLEDNSQILLMDVPMEINL
ncbi:pirin family protein [Filimonas effusa]|uniref:Pirin family protein n=1 Tax=Filimonas effusa TaxID=2508721 RepID=A0A4Q1D5Q8_9BACT|nr:pirin family protein [Filimonas effusa]RXK83728.1 pirin family protein [Filimonas effusa]